MVNPIIALLIAALIGGALATLWWPETGLLARWQRGRHFTERVLQEDALKHIYKWEMENKNSTIESIAGTLHININETAVLLNSMQENGLLTIQEGVIGLTANGQETALHIIRAHRLWERHLAEETGFAETEWHGQAERREHALSPEDLQALSARLGNPTHDPHGDPIPTAGGDVQGHGGRPLTQLPLNTAARIVHLEDEPDVVYAQLVAEGLHLGMPIRIIEQTPERVRFWANGDEHKLAPMLANNISVLPLPVAEVEELNGDELLTNIDLGETAVVTKIAPTCRGAERRRFMDLGILPGTEISAEMRSPSGDPTAFRVRDAIIALRKEQSSMIRVKRVEVPA